MMVIHSLVCHVSSHKADKVIVPVPAEVRSFQYRAHASAQMRK